MQRLILIRHGEAERDAPAGGGDFARTLTDRGRHESTRLGVRLAEAGLTPDVALVSSSARTRETWEYVAKAWGAVETRTLRELYDADADTVMGVARDDETETVAIVIHNPAAQILAARLLRDAGDAEAAAKAERRFPAAGAVVVEFGAGASPAMLFDPADDPAEA